MLFSLEIRGNIYTKDLKKDSNLLDQIYRPSWNSSAALAIVRAILSLIQAPHFRHCKQTAGKHEDCRAVTKRLMALNAHKVSSIFVYPSSGPYFNFFSKAHVGFDCSGFVCLTAIVSPLKCILYPSIILRTVIQFVITTRASLNSCIMSVSFYLAPLRRNDVLC